MGIADDFDRAIDAEKQRDDSELARQSANEAKARQLEPLVRAQFREAAQVLAARNVPMTRHFSNSYHNGFFGTSVRLKEEIYGWEIGGVLLLADGRVVRIPHSYYGDDHSVSAPKQYAELDYFEIPVTTELFDFWHDGSVLVRVSGWMVDDSWSSLSGWLVSHMSRAAGVKTDTPYMKWVGTPATNV